MSLCCDGREGPPRCKRYYHTMLQNVMAMKRCYDTMLKNAMAMKRCFWVSHHGTAPSTFRLALNAMVFLGHHTTGLCTLTHPSLFFLLSRVQSRRWRRRTSYRWPWTTCAQRRPWRHASAPRDMGLVRARPCHPSTSLPPAMIKRKRDSRATCSGVFGARETRRGKSYDEVASRHRRRRLPRRLKTARRRVVWRFPSQPVEWWRPQCRSPVQEMPCGDRGDA